MADGPTFSLESHPVHLGLGATVVPLDPITDMAWYEAYGTRFASDGAEGRLVSMYAFDQSWDMWEVHPKGEELVVCLRGTVTLHQELPSGTATVTLTDGEAVVNPPGVWHTADVADGDTVQMLFITAGEGTEHRPR